MAMQLPGCGQQRPELFRIRPVRRIIFTAPAASGTVDITLTGKDPDGATGRAVLRLAIETGSALPPNPNNRPPLAAYDPVPVNFSENQSDGTTLRWAGSDPDGDPITCDPSLRSGQ